MLVIFKESSISTLDIVYFILSIQYKIFTFGRIFTIYS